MSFRNPVQFTTIASGQTLSGNVSLAAYSAPAVFAPLSLTAQMFLQVSFDTTSANFVRAQLRDASGDWVVNSLGGALGFALTLEDVAIPYEHCRVQLGGATTDVRTFVFVSKE